MSKKFQKSDKAILETTVALEITKFQRDSLQAQVDLLSVLLQAATQRAERAEERLHETTIMLSNLNMQASSIAARSNLTEILIEGRSVLKLGNPVFLPKKTLSTPH